MNENPMRDVIEQMKDKAQREGKQQTSPRSRQRRIHENLSMAWSAMKMVEESISRAHAYTEDESDEQDLVQQIGLAAEQLRRKIELAIDEIAGEEHE